MPAPVRPIVPDVVEEHFEEISFLLVQRRKLLFHADAGPRALADHDGRIAAHVDGLREAGDHARKVALAGLEGGAPFEKAAGLCVWLSLFTPPKEEVLAILDQADPETAPALREGLRLVPPDALDRALPVSLSTTIAPPALAVATDAWGWHGSLHPNRLAGLMAHADPAVRSAAARVAGFAPGTAAATERRLSDPDPGVRRRALHSLALASPPTALTRTRKAALGPAPNPFFIRILGLLAGPDDHNLLLRAVGTVGPPALHALGDAGYPRAVPMLLEKARGPDEAVAAAARDAVERITGLVPGEDGVKWWASLRDRFPDGRRFLRGRPTPHEGPPEEESLESRWFSAIRSGQGEPWRRRDVPDGFFTGLPCEEALPGE